MLRIYDISRTISPTLRVWPGDTPFSSEQQLHLQAGDLVNLMTLTMSAHTGTHADAYWHYEKDGATIAEMPLHKYIGAAQVVSVGRRHGGIVPADLADHDISGIQRILLHTWVSDMPDDQWAEGFPYPTTELIDWLADRGVVLLGLDSPSFDQQDAARLEGHHCLYQRQMVNLENLMLRDVPDGIYQLVALPLKIAGVCASPVRAILIDVS